MVLQPTVALGWLWMLVFSMAYSVYSIAQLTELHRRFCSDMWGCRPIEPMPIGLSGERLGRVLFRLGAESIHLLSIGPREPADTDIAGPTTLSLTLRWADQADGPLDQGPVDAPETPDTRLPTDGSDRCVTSTFWMELKPSRLMACYPEAVGAQVSRHNPSPIAHLKR